MVSQRTRQLTDARAADINKRYALIVPASGAFLYVRLAVNEQRLYKQTSMQLFNHEFPGDALAWRNDPRRRIHTLLGRWPGGRRSAVMAGELFQAPSGAYFALRETAPSELMVADAAVVKAYVPEVVPHR